MLHFNLLTLFFNKFQKSKSKTQTINNAPDIVDIVFMIYCRLLTVLGYFAASFDTWAHSNFQSSPTASV